MDNYCRIELIEKKKLLPYADRCNPDRQYYGISRERIAPFAAKYIEKYLDSHDSARVIEIGGGVGNATKKLSERFTNNNAVLFSLTSLTSLEQHQCLRDLGVAVHVPVVAEHLPSNWRNRFDFVLTDSVLGWTDIPKSLQEMKRVIKPGGFWLGFEFYDVYKAGTDELLKQVISRELAGLQMRNELRYTDVYYYKKMHEVHPFVVQMPE